MVSGRPRARRNNACRHLPARLLAAVPVVLCIAALGSSCRAPNEKARESAFASRLAEIDASLKAGAPRDIDRAFRRGYSKAGAPSDWLSLLKRAESASDVSRAPRCDETARRAVAAFPRHQVVREAAAHAYLRCGGAAKALALFGRDLPPASAWDLWAEAFMASAPGNARPSDYARLAEALDDPRPLLGAAVASLAEGDRASASAFLRRAESGGAMPSADLAWDCGLYDELAARPDAYGCPPGRPGAAAYASPEELELLGDAAWKVGDVDLAKRRWVKSISTGPRTSWRLYAKLALASGGDRDQAEAYWSRLRAAFLSGPPSADRSAALGAYAAHLARSGRSREALSMLGAGDGASASLRLAIASPSMPEGRYAVELELLAARAPDDPEAQGFALRELARRGLYSEVAALAESAARRKVPVGDLWFYEAATEAARGRYAAASSLVESRDGGESAEGAFALGSLAAARGESREAARRYAAAAAVAAAPRDRCSALKSLGRELDAAGDPRGAAGAFRRAAAADPSDAEAAVLAKASGGTSKVERRNSK